MAITSLSAPISLDHVYDAILQEMVAQHPSMPEALEASLKARLLILAVAADSGECKPADLLWLFREAMNSV